MTTPFMPGMVSYHATAGEGAGSCGAAAIVAPVVSSLPTNIATGSAPINLAAPTPSELDAQRPRHSDGADQANRTDRDIGIVNDESLPDGRHPGRRSTDRACLALAQATPESVAYTCDGAWTALELPEVTLQQLR
jgi:hypothetical protein